MMREKGIGGNNQRRVEEWMREEVIGKNKGGGIDWREEGLDGRRVEE